MFIDLCETEDLKTLVKAGFTTKKLQIKYTEKRDKGKDNSYSIYTIFCSFSEKRLYFYSRSSHPIEKWQY